MEDNTYYPTLDEDVDPRELELILDEILTARSDCTEFYSRRYEGAE